MNEENSKTEAPVSSGMPFSRECTVCRESNLIKPIPWFLPVAGKADITEMVVKFLSIPEKGMVRIIPYTTSISADFIIRNKLCEVFKLPEKSFNLAKRLLNCFSQTAKLFHNEGGQNMKTFRLIVGQLTTIPTNISSLPYNLIQDFMHY